MHVKLTGEDDAVGDAEEYQGEGFSHHCVLFIDQYTQGRKLSFRAVTEKQWGDK